MMEWTKTHLILFREDKGRSELNGCNEQEGSREMKVQKY